MNHSRSGVRSSRVIETGEGPLGRANPLALAGATRASPRPPIGRFGPSDRRGRETPRPTPLRENSVTNPLRV